MAFVYNSNFNSDKNLLNIGNESIEYTPLQCSKDASNTLSFFSTVNNPNNTNLTLYWTTSAGNFEEVQNLTGPILPNPINGNVVTLHENKGMVYIGGDFTLPYKKVCVLDTKRNILLEDLLTSFGPLVDYGSINSITTYNDLVILGGDFKGNAEEGGVLGKGLAIINPHTKEHFPFYVNGRVNAVEIHENFLYIAGNFDYLNYTAQPVSELTGLRVYTKGFVRIDLTKLEQFPQHSIDRDFVNYYSTFTKKIPIVNVLTSIGKYLYIGGKFELEDATQQVTPSKTFKCKSITRLSSAGFDSTWDPILNGEVSCIKFHEDSIYVGGKFDYFCLNRDLNPTNLDNVDRTFNLIRFNTKLANLAYDGSWVPKADNAVTSLAFQGHTIYCYGKFREFNNHESGFLAACNTESATDVIHWPYNLQSGPITNIGQSILSLNSKILVGGTFLQCNEAYKPFLTYIPYVDPLTEPLFSKLLLNVYVYAHGVDITKKSSLIEKTVIPNKPYHMNMTTFNIKTEDVNGCTPGTLIKFCLDHVPGEGHESFSSPICLLGWSLN
jgi:hypothetical protein